MSVGTFIKIRLSAQLVVSVVELATAEDVERFRDRVSFFYKTMHHGFVVDMGRAVFGKNS